MALCFEFLSGISTDWCRSSCVSRFPPTGKIPVKNDEIPPQRGINDGRGVRWPGCQGARPVSNSTTHPCPEGRDWGILRRVPKGPKGKGTSREGDPFWVWSGIQSPACLNWSTDRTRAVLGQSLSSIGKRSATDTASVALGQHHSKVQCLLGFSHLSFADPLSPDTLKPFVH